MSLSMTYLVDNSNTIEEVIPRCRNVPKQTGKHCCCLGSLLSFGLFGDNERYNIVSTGFRFDIFVFMVLNWTNFLLTRQANQGLALIIHTQNFGKVSI